MTEQPQTAESTEAPKPRLSERWAKRKQKPLPAPTAPRVRKPRRKMPVRIETRAGEDSKYTDYAGDFLNPAEAMNFLKEHAELAGPIRIVRVLAEFTMKVRTPKPQMDFEFPA